MHNFKIGEIVTLNGLGNTRAKIFVALKMKDMVGNSYQIELVKDEFVCLNKYWFSYEDVTYAYGGQFSDSEDLQLNKIKKEILSFDPENLFL